MVSEDGRLVNNQDSDDMLAIKYKTNQDTGRTVGDVLKGLLGDVLNGELGFDA